MKKLLLYLTLSVSFVFAAEVSLADIQMYQSLMDGAKQTQTKQPAIKQQAVQNNIIPKEVEKKVEKPYISDKTFKYETTKPVLKRYGEGFFTNQNILNDWRK